MAASALAYSCVACDAKDWRAAMPEAVGIAPGVIVGFPMVTTPVTVILQKR